MENYLSCNNQSFDREYEGENGNEKGYFVYTASRRQVYVEAGIINK